ncbi:hypothetical protein SASPL_104935 [Salvia splendens]|uniref:Uncharacterized protein n=1 Tax=Salvia splendens TaxID=180675 RepID=A0A8X8YIY8_SALSN|nr:hypothetical protein SASPL_104935 [Salvia splendens]
MNNTRVDLPELHQMLKTYESLLRDQFPQPSKNDKKASRGRNLASSLHVEVGIPSPSLSISEPPALQSRTRPPSALLPLGAPPPLPPLGISYQSSIAKGKYVLMRSSSKMFSKWKNKRPKKKNASKDVVLKPKGGWVKKKPALLKDECLFCHEKGH